MRFVIWCLAVLAVQVCRWFELGRLPIVGCLLVILVLLWTTSGDALRLPRGSSEIFIPVGSFSPQRHGGWVLVHLAIVILMLMILRLWGKSAWWAVLFAWF